MEELEGIQAAPGIGIGPAFIYIDEDLSVPNYSIVKSDIASEWERFKAAVSRATAEVTELRDRAEREMGKEQSLIFDAHILMLADPEYHDEIEKRLSETLKNIEFIIFELERELTTKLGASEDQYLRERSIDIHDVSKRILNQLLHRKKLSLSSLDKEVIIVGHNLLPSDMITMNRAMVKGIAMDVGGKTSHTAILARAFEIPAVLGLSKVTKEIKPDEILIIDGNAGKIVVTPDEKTLARYRETKERMQSREAELQRLAKLPAESPDGKKYSLEANIEIPEEVDQALAHGAEGIGLYRSEFLFLGPGNFSSEDEQYESYSRVLKAMQGRPVTIRTLDIGGDKMVAALEAIGEKNPLLGWRAIRFCLSNREIFKIQLRAMLRASVHGSMQIMFPMISGIEEYESALEVLEEAKAELTVRGQPFAKDIPVGCMIEIPSAAMTSDILAKKARFFSIGTNDLIQYSIAVDRGNEKTAYLYQPFHPGVLRLIKATIDNAHEAGIKVCLCGEMAGDPYATAILMGLGLDEFSMSSGSIPEIKRVIRSVRKEEAVALTSSILTESSYRAIDAKVRAWVDKRFDIGQK